MHPLFHITLTLLFSIPFALKMKNPNIIFFAVLSTVAVDIFDHGLYVVFSRDDLANNVRGYFRKWEIYPAWKYYYSNRKGKIDFLLIHNLISFTILSIITVLAYNIDVVLFYILAIGIIFHIICDLFEDFMLGGDKRFWYNGWRIFLKRIIY